MATDELNKSDPEVLLRSLREACAAWIRRASSEEMDRDLSLVVETPTVLFHGVGFDTIAAARAVSAEDLLGWEDHPDGADPAIRRAEEAADRFLGDEYLARIAEEVF